MTELKPIKMTETGWHKCTDGLPEEDDSVLFSDGKYIYLGCWTTWDVCEDDSYDDGIGWVENALIGGNEKEFGLDEIKYWMPLPKAPEEE